MDQQDFEQFLIKSPCIVTFDLNHTARESIASTISILCDIQVSVLVFCFISLT